ncbi:MAG: SGNH/GDSL hydrolase family protein [Clostridia bacterium]|nr:SGNH/GDSL hydrolase family protein [Clostridia bacterium]
MKLTNETIRSITFGATRIEEQEDGLHFYRCTPKQIAAWEALNSTLGYRARCTGGVRFDFHTNSTRLLLAVAQGIKFDVLIDGLLAAHFDFNYEKNQTVAGLELGDGEKRVTVIFPSHDDSGVLRYLELDDGATVNPHVYDKKFLFIGDSITQGWNTVYDSNSYAYLVSRHFNADCVINGIGGAYFHETVFDRPNFDPDDVFVAYGTNDFGHHKSLDDLRHHCGSFLDQVIEAYPNAKIHVIAPIFRTDLDKVRKMGSWQQCRDAIFDEINKRNLHLIDGYTLVPHLPEYFADAEHPNDLGFAAYAENLIKALT